MPSRRRFLLSTAGLIATTPLAGSWASKSGAHPFSLGVASGCPREDRVTLWTRVAPAPLEGGGATKTDLKLRCRVCLDPGLRHSVIDRVVTAPAEDAHSVHFTASGLKPYTEYFYQFYLGEDASPIGRTLTAPARSDDLPLRLAFASCQHFEYGFYCAYRDIAATRPDLVVHLGDYIYEYAPTPLGTAPHPLVEAGLNESGPDITVVRQHLSPEIRTLWDYRNRYAQYRLDPDLQAAHAATPWVVSFDDHEIDNNWAGYIPEDPDRQTDLEFRVRRWAALKAFYEHMPLEQRPSLNGLNSSLRIHDQFKFGRQLNLVMLDTRQYRSDQPCGQAFPGDVDCSDRYNPGKTMIGLDQERWLANTLRQSDARWNLIAQQTWFSEFRYPENRFNMDQWDGYTAQRSRIITEIANPNLENPVVISGDWHCGAAFDVLKDFSQPESATPVAAELAVTSISSPCTWSSSVAEALPENPHTQYFGGDQRGYLHCELNSTELVATYRVVDRPIDNDSEVLVDKILQVTDKRRGLLL